MANCAIILTLGFFVASFECKSPFCSSVHAHETILSLEKALIIHSREYRRRRREEATTRYVERSSATSIAALAREIWALDGKSKMVPLAIDTLAYAIHFVRHSFHYLFKRLLAGGAYAVADGGGPKPTIPSGAFNLGDDRLLKFCYYQPSALSNLVVNAVRGGRQQEVRMGMA